MLTPRKADLFGTLDALAAVIPQEILALGPVRTDKKQRQSRTKTGEGRAVSADSRAAMQKQGWSHILAGN